MVGTAAIAAVYPHQKPGLNCGTAPPGSNCVGPGWTVPVSTKLLCSGKWVTRQNHRARVSAWLNPRCFSFDSWRGIGTTSTSRPPPGKAWMERPLTRIGRVECLKKLGHILPLVIFEAGNALLQAACIGPPADYRQPGLSLVKWMW